MQKEDYALNVIFLCQKYILPLKLPLQLLNDPFRWNGNTESKIYHTSTNTNTCRTRLVHVARAGLGSRWRLLSAPAKGKTAAFGRRCPSDRRPPVSRWSSIPEKASNSGCQPKDTPAWPPNTYDFFSLFSCFILFSIIQHSLSGFKFTVSFNTHMSALFSLLVFSGTDKLNGHFFRVLFQN